MKPDKTLICVSKDTASRLKRIGSMCDTYEVVIKRLIEEGGYND